MNNKEFISALSRRTGYSVKKTTKLLDATFSTILEELQEGRTISIQGFGSFEVKKKAERIAVNPVNNVRTLIPPKLMMAFKPGTTLREKFKSR